MGVVLPTARRAGNAGLERLGFHVARTESAGREDSASLRPTLGTGVRVQFGVRLPSDFKVAQLRWSAYSERAFFDQVFCRTRMLLKVLQKEKPTAAEKKRAWDPAYFQQPPGVATRAYTRRACSIPGQD